MSALITGFSTSAGIFKLIALLIVFIGIVFLSYYFTKWYAKSGFIKKSSGNIEILETYQISPGKFIYIARIGEKCVSFLTSKDNVVKLTELSEDELCLIKPQQPLNDVSFKDIIGKVTKGKKEKG